MIERPKFRSQFRVETLEPDVVFLLSEAGPFVLEGRLHALLAPLMNGKNSAADIVKQLKGQATVLDIQYGLLWLEEHECIVEASDSDPPGLVAFRNLLNVNEEVLENRLRKGRISVTSFGAAPVAPFTSILESLGVRVAEAGDLSVVLVDDYLREGLDDFNRQATRGNRPWMLVKPVGTVLWIGPIFRPSKTACWACLATRLEQNRRAQALAAASTELSSTFETALNLAASVTLTWIVRGRYEDLEGKIVTLDTQRMESAEHVLLRQPNCRSCGEPQKDSSTSPAPLVLESRKKLFVSDGGHFSALPETTLREYEHHISPITGTISKVEPRALEENSPAYVYVAEHGFTLGRDPRPGSSRSLAGRSAGKGMTRPQAKASALCEALERYSGVFRGDEIRKKASYRTLGESVIHPNACMNFSQKQYEQREEWNKRESEYNWVPQPFDEERETEWAPVWSLTAEGFKYVSAAYCYYGYPISEEHDFCRADSNGNAAGNTLEEAILQGFMELVERDSVALWWYARARRPAVDLDSFAQPYFKALRTYYRTLGRELWVLDITSDFNIPAFAAVSRRIGSDDGEVIFGFGAHLDAVVGISRALTEMNQLLPSVLSGKASRIFVGELLDGAFLAPDTSAAPKTPEDFPRVWSDDLREDVMTCVKLAETRGMETLVLDQTRSEVGLRVVKVMAPGTRQSWARFAPGRLYDVPVTLGWLRSRLTEDQLNPAHLLI